MTALFPCPCCGYLTSSEPGSHDICPICDWEDDLSQLRFPRSGGGANHESLEEAQANFAKIGVKSAAHLRT
jgi:anaerobic ribonucleoside-triphosphate reductase